MSKVRPYSSLIQLHRETELIPGVASQLWSTENVERSSDLYRIHFENPLDRRFLRSHVIPIRPQIWRSREKVSRTSWSG